MCTKPHTGEEGNGLVGREQCGRVAADPITAEVQVLFGDLPVGAASMPQVEFAEPLMFRDQAAADRFQDRLTEAVAESMHEYAESVGPRVAAASVGMLEAAEPLDKAAKEALAEHRKDYATAAGREQLEITFSVYNGDPNGESDLCHLANFSVSFVPGTIEGFIEELERNWRGEPGARQTDPPARSVRGHRTPAGSANKKSPQTAEAHAAAGQEVPE